MVKSKYEHSYSFADYTLIFATFLIGVGSILLIQSPVFASGSQLTDLFNTQTFRGSATALTGANWVGMFLHYAISWFSFLGLCLTIYQKFITLLYLSNRNLFDTIYEIKTEKVKGSFFGFKDFGKGLWDTSASASGGGIDIVITFFYGLLPNIKAYSDFSPTKSTGAQGKMALDENDGVTAYMLKTALPTISLIFVLTIGWSGTLTKVYGTAVDGLATVADNFVNTNLSAYVDRLVGEAGGYDFTLSSSGTASGAYAATVAKSMYTSVLGMTNSADVEFQQALGRVIEDAVAGNGVKGTGASTSILDGGTSDEVARANLLKLVNATLPSSSQLTGSTLSESEVNALKSPSVYINTSPTIVGNAGVSWSVNDLLAATGFDITTTTSIGDRYIHVCTYQGYAASTTYLAQLEGSSSDSSSSDGYIAP